MSSLPWIVAMALVVLVFVIIVLVHKVYALARQYRYNINARRLETYSEYKGMYLPCGHGLTDQFIAHLRSAPESYPTSAVEVSESGHGYVRVFSADALWLNQQTRMLEQVDRQANIERSRAKFEAIVSKR